jgi:carbon storage regulator
MLVISRKTSESFVIGNDIRIKILEINGDKVKIGIEAPKSVNVLRSEVFETINANIDAVQAASPKELNLLKNKIINGDKK